MSIEERAVDGPYTPAPTHDTLPRIRPEGGAAWCRDRAGDEDTGGEDTQYRGRGEGRASARFLWIDDETGDELVVEVSGGEGFYRELEKIGFLREAEQDPAGPEGPQGAGAPASWTGSHESAPRRSEAGRLSARMDVGSRDRGAGEGSKGADRTWQERRRA